MHIPDGFLDFKTVSGTNLFSFLTLIYSIKRILKKLTPERVPLLGIFCALIFLIQAISFPVPYGTSVHLSGIFLISLILGPFSSFFLSFFTLLISAIILGHGGILTIGANSFNLSFIGGIFCFYLYKFLEKILQKIKYFLIFFVSFLSIVLGSIFCTFFLSISGKILFSKAILPMLFSHIVAGIVEGIFTCSIIKFFEKVKPEILKIEKI
jgi:cobalt/nickel transport system permease protein